MNILLTCAGRRSYLVRLFQEARCGRREVLARDCSAVAPAIVEADRSLAVPRIDAVDYLDTLLSSCRQYPVDLVMRANDLELGDRAQTAPAEVSWKLQLTEAQRSGPARFDLQPTNSNSRERRPS